MSRRKLALDESVLECHPCLCGSRNRKSCTMPELVNKIEDNTPIESSLWDQTEEIAHVCRVQALEKRAERCTRVGKTSLAEEC